MPGITKKTRLSRAAKACWKILLGPELFEKIEFFRRLRYWPDLETPETFNEKICTRKLRGDHKLLSRVADKIQVRQYVDDKCGGEILTTLYGTYSSYREVDTTSLPRSFVAKTNNGSGPGFIAVVNDVSDHSARELTSTLKKLDREMRRTYLSFHYTSNESWYRHISPQLLLEEKIPCDPFGTLTDYKFFVFNGSVQAIDIHTGRGADHRRALLTPNWTPFDLRYNKPRLSIIPDQPPNLKDMIRIAERLGKDWTFIRVDLYNPFSDYIKFGELTLAPARGHGRFVPSAYDDFFGSFWEYNRY